MGESAPNLSALISEQAFDDLDAPVRRVSGADVPMPYSKPLEDIAYPHEPQVVAAALEVLGQAPPADATPNGAVANPRAVTATKAAGAD